MNIGNQNTSRAEDREKRWRTHFALTLPLLAGLLFISALAPGLVLAQAEAGNVAPRANRCLLVVETSRAMQRQSEAVLQIVQDMLRSGLSGQLHGGDTLGVWTYNESLYAGRFRLQTWSPETQNDITQRVLTFLKDQKYEQQASFDKVLPALSRLIKDSPLLTVIVISSPDEKTRGPRYDYPVNQAYENRKWREEQERAWMPLVTIFQAQDGQLGNYTAITPQERQRAEMIQAKLLEAVRNSPPTASPPVVFSVEERQQRAQTLQAKLLEAMRNAPLTNAAPVVVSRKTTQPVQAPAPKPFTEPKVEVAEAPEPKPIVLALPTPEPKPSAPELPKPAPAPESKPVSAAKAVMEPKAEVAKAPEAKPIAPAQPAPQTVSAVPARTPEPKPAAPELPKPAPAPESKPTPAPKVEIVKAPEAKPAAPAPLKAELAPAPPPPTPPPAPAPSAAQEVSSGTSPKATAAASTSPGSLTVSNTPIQTATAVPAETLVRNRTIWIAGLVLAGAAFSLALVLLRRSRAAAGEGSLITQSFYRKHKP